MKSFLTTIAIIFSSVLVYSQNCAPGVFDSQQKIDDFSTNYPNCTSLFSDLIIQEAVPGDITNLNGLSQITSLYKGLNISNNIALTDVSGLENITHVSNEIRIQNNDNLNNLAGLDNIDYIGDYLYIGQNSDLVSLWPSNNLTSLGDYLAIYDNPLLENISCLSGLSGIIEDISINNNQSLISLDGLQNITSSNLNLKIENNVSLIDLSGLNNLTTVENSVTIKYNSLQSLSGLDNLTTINNALILNENSINDISNLSTLTYIGGPLRFENCDNLTNLTGLDNLTYIGGELSFINNSSLENLDALLMITSLNRWIFIENNDALTNLSGLNNILSIDGYIYIADNNNLTDISGIENIDATTIHSWSPNFYDDLSIFNNPLLSECNVQSVCDFLLLPDKTSDIHDNMNGCNNEDQIANACGIVLPPDCTLLTEPQNGETDVIITTDLTWQSVSDADGYILNVGTTSGGTDILDNEDVGNVTTYNPGDLPCGSNIYVTIIPYNSGGNASGCDEEYFSTENVIADAGNDTETCYGSSTQLQANGGTLYSWSPSQGLDDPNIANPIASPNSTTIYTVTVSNDGRCPDIDDVIVVVNPNPIPDASAVGESSNNANDGSATCEPTSGTPDYTYLWSNGATTQTITGLSPGEYTVTVFDSKSCSASETVTVEEYICPNLSLETEQTNVSCYGDCNGSIAIISVNNGIPPFSYIWSNNETTSTIYDLCSGSYSVTVTDSYNCQIIEFFEVAEPEELYLIMSSTNETSENAEDGTATANPFNGTAPYSYLWSTFDTTQSITGLAPGFYSVTVTDSNDCTAIDSVEILEFICPSYINSSISNISCFNMCNGSITVDEVVDATLPLSYIWSNGQTENGIYNLCSGNYSVTITDAQNCEIFESYFIDEPEEIIVNISSTDETASGANDGSATCTPSGGTSPYNYMWNTGDTTQSILGLAPGNYSVTVTDANGCQFSDMTNVAQFGCEGLSIEINQTNNSCYNSCDGSLEVLGVTNGTPPFTYYWDLGDTTSSISNLCPGLYVVSVIDANNCNIVGDYTIGNTSLLFANATATPETYYNANDGTATCFPTGGTPPYSFLWNTGHSTQSIFGLSPGEYYVTVTDSLQCSAYDTVFIEKFICPEIEINSQFTNISCYGYCDGSITILNVNNTVAPIKYFWNTGSDSTSINNLCLGEYIVTVTDSNNCSTSDTFNITQPDEITIIIDTIIDVRLNTPGKIEITTNNSGNYIFDWKGPDNFTAKTEDLEDLINFGCYTLTVTDTITNCSIDSTICLLDKTRVFEQKIANINFYPNPAKENFIIDFSDTKSNQAEIAIFDISGKKLLNLQKKSGEKFIKVESTSLNSGLYIIRIKFAKLGTLYKKIMISK